MNLLSAIAAGIAAAPNGSVELYIRGTTTRATWWGDFEASAPNSSGADIPLDDYGSAVIYVNQLVDLVVKDSSGVTVRAYTDGYASPNVEVISQSFTGTDYVTAASAASEPTTLQAVLDLWKTNAGAIDWKVTVGGVATSLQNIGGAISGLVFNVKSPEFGAVGDGVVNDQAAIAAALAAAVAAGGGTVYLPPGTYKISTAIEWSHVVNLVGAGASLSIISQSSASNARILTWTSGTGQKDPQLISGVGFSASVSNTGEQLYASAVGVNWRIVDCGFGLSTNCTGNLVRTIAGGRVSFQDCRFTTYGSGNAVFLDGGTTYSVAVGCYIETGNTSYNASLVQVGAGSFVFLGCVFDASNVLGAPTLLYGINQGSSQSSLLVAGCTFKSSAQFFTACLSLLAGAFVTATGNNFTSGTPTRYVLNGNVLGSGSHLEFVGTVRDSSNSTTPTISNACEVYEFSSTGTKPTWTMPVGYFSGQMLQVVVYNHSGGTWALGSSFTGAQLASTVSIVAVGTTGIASYSFVYTDLLTAGTYAWLLYSAS